MHIVTDGVVLLYFDLSLLAHSTHSTHSTLSFSGFQIYIVLLKHKVAFGICIDYAMVLKSRSESLRRACMHACEAQQLLRSPSYKFRSFVNHGW